MTTTANLATRLAETIGSTRIVTATDELPTYAIDSLTPSAIVRPASAAEAAEVVRFALAQKLSVVPLGSRSKCDTGMPPANYDIALDMTAMREVVHYDAGDLTLSIDAGMPLRELQAFLKTHGQFLPLAVPCFESTTAAGTVASGIESVLRMQYGTARDFLIGAEFIDGTGQSCRSGGRVVKNVTGYDLHKLLIGSLGTLGVITRLNFRTFPIPAARAAHIAAFPDCERALAHRKTVENSGLPLANLEVLSPDAIKRIASELSDRAKKLLDLDHWCVIAVYEGNDAVVRRISGDLRRIAGDNHSQKNDLLDSAATENLAVSLREMFDLLRQGSPATLLCRIILPEIQARTLQELSPIARALSLETAVLVRAASVLYFAAFAENDGETFVTALAKVASSTKALATRQRGHATVLHAPSAVKRVLASSTTNDDLCLDVRAKQAFDPCGVFAAGRIVGRL